MSILFFGEVISRDGVQPGPQNQGSDRNASIKNKADNTILSHIAFASKSLTGAECRYSNIE